MSNLTRIALRRGLSVASALWRKGRRRSILSIVQTERFELFIPKHTNCSSAIASLKRPKAVTPFFQCVISRPPWPA